MHTQYLQMLCIHQWSWQGQKRTGRHRRIHYIVRTRPRTPTPLRRLRTRWPNNHRPGVDDRTQAYKTARPKPTWKAPKKYAGIPLSSLPGTHQRSPARMHTSTSQKCAEISRASKPTSEAAPAPAGCLAGLKPPSLHVCSAQPAFSPAISVSYTIACTARGLQCKQLFRDWFVPVPPLRMWVGILHAISNTVIVHDP